MCVCMYVGIVEGGEGGLLLSCFRKKVITRGVIK